MVHALPVSVLVLSLVYYWFAIADRYMVFLYYHDMGPLVPDTSPFSRVTSSRYWMTGLVAGGVVMVSYTGISWLLGRLAGRYRPSAWWRVWGISSALLISGVPLITMTVNEPVLSPGHAFRTTLATVISLGVALRLGKMAAEDPWGLVCLSMAGWAMAAVLLSVTLLEGAWRMLERGATWPLWLVGIGLGGAVGLILAMTGLRIWRHMSMPGVSSLFVAGLGVAYLLLPLIHYLGFTDGYWYISDKDNYFSRSWIFPMIAWLVAAAVAVGVTRLREYLVMRWIKLRSIESSFEP